MSTWQSSNYSKSNVTIRSTVKVKQRNHQVKTQISIKLVIKIKKLNDQQFKEEIIRITKKNSA